ncbi:MAG TPA: carboxypeptidase regulatory-like domain-containing protein [Terriglobales bacterium]|nr:carboxypeptidase regulatory-like domain-containing protein [Terriglobales bacterium]
MGSNSGLVVRAVLCSAVVAVVFSVLVTADAWAQGETTSAILGQVTDSTNAVVPGAMVTVTNRDTGFTRTARTDQAGRFNFPQLLPGTYTVSAEAQGFELQQAENVVAGLGQKQTVNLTLRVAQSRQTVEVNSEAPIVNPANANTTTTLSAPTLENLPNPGSDMTYPLQFAPGALINTAGNGNDFVGGTNGYGNVEFNGLPALSNGYIVDGLETNDPLTNLNSGLATNLVLGLNSISEVTVNTLSYSVDQGRYGASQVNYVTKSGTNQFHGNLYEVWNGSILNAADYFTNATTGNHKPRSTVNHFGGSLGGPIIHDKLFFFFDSEWVRIALPIFSTITVPSPAFQQYLLQQLPLGGTDTVTGSHYGPAPQLVPFYQKMFSLYQNTSGTPLPVLGCPFNSDTTPAPGSPPSGNGCANRRAVSHSSDDHEQVQTTRIDYNAGTKDTFWFRFQSDTGLQAAYTDPINPLFNSVSSQPLYSFAAGYTHVFSQNLVNYFNPAFSWYESLFAPSDFQQTLAAFPIVLQGIGANAPFTTIGGLDNTWLQGRRASRFFINDNLAWSHGAHELRFGTNTRIFGLNDFDFGEGTVPTVTYTTLPQFIYGVASTASKTFPTSANEPFNFLNLDFYAQDTWKVTPKLTWTFGVRNTFNSNPQNPHNQIARLKGSFDSMSHDVNQPYWAKDIQELFRLEKHSSFQKFTELLMTQSGGLFEATRFTAPCEVSRTTISNYLNVLEETFVAHVIRPFSSHRPTEIVSAPKVYGFETGFVAYYRGWQDLRREDLGALWEHFVLNEIMAHQQNRDISYWRDKRGHEVDFVLTARRNKPIAIECKWSAADFDATNLQVFRRQYSDGENFVLAQDVDRPYSRHFGEITVRFENLGTFVKKIGPARMEV